MTNTRGPNTDPGGPLVYQIRIKGHLGRHWADWFEGLTVTALDNGETLLTGPVVDQAALYGLLKKVRDVGMPLLSVMHVKPGQAEASNSNETSHARAKRRRKNEDDQQDDRKAR